MVSSLFDYQLVLVALVWLFMMLHLAWSSQAAMSHPRPAEPEPITHKPKRSTEPKPFAGLTQRPPCALCEQETADTAPPPVRPAPMPYSQNTQTASFSVPERRPEHTFLLSTVPPPHNQLDTALIINRPVSSRISLQRSPTVSSRRSTSSAVIAWGGWT